MAAASLALFSVVVVWPALRAVAIARRRASALGASGRVRRTAPSPGSGIQRIAAALRARRGRATEDQLPELLERVGWELRSGRALPQAFREAAAGVSGALGAALAPCVGAIDDGRPFEVALGRWVPAAGDRTQGLVVAALTVGARAGGASADALDGVASTVRDRQAIARETRAMTAQARASAVVIVLAPVLFGAALAAGDQQVWQFLTGDGAGRACLISGMVLDVAGALWMQRIGGAALR